MEPLDCWLKRSGGVAIVQDPDEARFPDMPRCALASVTVDYTVPLSRIAPLLVRLVASDD
jgi:two-component system, chemotaxis family, protein-glutamate methylesterase/glutaminase